jgi:hypothetical protein
MNLGNWNTGILSTACVVFGLVLGFLVGGLFAPPVAGGPWLKTYSWIVSRWTWARGRDAECASMGMVSWYVARIARNATETYWRFFTLKNLLVAQFGNSYRWKPAPLSDSQD